MYLRGANHLELSSHMKSPAQVVSARRAVPYSAATTNPPVVASDDTATLTNGSKTPGVANK